MHHFVTTTGCLAGFGLLASLPSPTRAGEVTIELPVETARFRTAPGSELAAAFCLTCHSADYTETQPPMPRPFWEAEVKKMQEKYFAPIPAGVDGQIVDYLTRAYGAAEPGARGK